MDRSDYPDTYQRLGGEAFARANELAKWPAVTVAASKRCDKVGVAYISDRATSERLVWFVDCENRERFWIAEVEAVATRDNFDDDGVAQIDIPAPAPASAAFDDMSEADVIARCDTAVKSALKSQSSFDPGSRLQFMKHQHNGRVTAIRDFEAQKAFGATLSSRYVCLVDVASMELVEVRIRESGDWKTLY